MPFGGLLTLGLISGGTALVSGALGAHAASSAADKQTASADKALALQSQIYGNTRADLSPFVSLGTGALSNLRKLGGVPNVQSGSMTPAPMAPVVTNRVQGSAPTIGTAVPRNAATLSTFGQAPSGTASGYVTMRAPDGSTNQVPANQVQHWTSRGAQVING